LAVAAVAAGAYLPLYNELEKFTISWLVPASLYTHNKLAPSFANQTQYLWPRGMANGSIINILQGPQQCSRLWHMLDFLFTLAITHKYYNIFTRALHNVSNERNMLAPSQLVAEHKTIERFLW